MQRVLMIIPAYNEEISILSVVENIMKVKTKDFMLDYIVVNDGSKDKTREVLIKNKLNFIDLPCNLGIGGAVQTGYKYAFYHDYDIAIQFDGDNQHDASFIPDLVTNIKKGNDLVIGSRFVGDLSEFKSSKLRRMGINLLSGIIKICTGVKIYDVTSGYRACNKKLISYFANNYPVDYPEPDSLVQVLKMKYKVREIPVIMHERKTGKSSINGFKSIYYMIKVILAIIIADISTKGDD